MMIVAARYTLILSLVSCAVLAASLAAGPRPRGAVFRSCLLFGLYLTMVGGLYHLNLRSLAFSGGGGALFAGLFILGFFGLIFVLPFFIHSLAPGGGDAPSNVFWALAAFPLLGIDLAKSFSRGIRSSAGRVDGVVYRG